MEEKMTVKQVLEMTAEMLGGIDVPIKYIDSIGIPVANAIKNISLCVDAMNMQEAEKADGEDNA